MNKIVIAKKPKWPKPQIFVEVGPGKGKVRIAMKFDDFVGAIKAEIKHPLKFQTKKGLFKAISIAIEKVLIEMREAPQRAVKNG
jgi:hypothetical protein